MAEDKSFRRFRIQFTAPTKLNDISKRQSHGKLAIYGYLANTHTLECLCVCVCVWVSGQLKKFIDVQIKLQVEQRDADGECKFRK